MGAEVVPVESGGRTLKDAINEALRDWSASFETTHYLLGTAAGPHPFPTMVREFQRVIGREARAQILEQLGRLARRGRRLRRRRVERDRPVRRLHRRRRPADRRRSGRARGSMATSMARRCFAARPASCTAPRPTSCRMRTGRSPTPGPSPPGLDYPAVGPGACASQGQRPRGVCRCDRRRSARRLQGAGGKRRHHLRVRIRARARARAEARRAGARQRDPRRPVRPRRQGRRSGCSSAGVA